MAWNDGIDGTSLGIAASREHRIRVMAGPGTGKSFAMKRRVARLIEEGCPPERILAVTLTRNAAKELVKDLKELGVPGCDHVKVGTLHSYCFSLLLRTGYFELIGRKPRLLMMFEDSPLVHDLIKVGGFGGVRKCRSTIKAFEAAWARRQDEDPGWPADPVDQLFNETLKSWLSFHGALRVGELTPFALAYLASNPASEELTAYDHVVVDEYQDLNRAEQDLIAVLAGGCDCAIVGDVDQSIYSFRHAHPEGIRDFHTIHLGTHDESLDECRRCPKLVVRLADELILKNHPPATPTRLKVCPSNIDGAVEVVQWSDLNAEVSGLALYIKKMIELGSKPEDIMVLCPSRDVGHKIRDMLRNDGVTAHSFYSEDALDDIRAQYSFSLLTLLVSPEDRVSWRFALGYGSPNYLAGQNAKLREYCERSGESPKNVLASIKGGSISIPGTSKLSIRFTLIENELIGMAALSGTPLADRLFPSTEEWAQPVRLIIDRILDSGTSAKDMHSEIIEAITQPEIPNESGFVRIMSLHKSKGLSCKMVVVAACVQGLIPRFPKNAINTVEEKRHFDEQRRLFYVAMTRAREKLIISSSVSWPRSDALKNGVSLKPRSGNREFGHACASQFLGELGSCTPAPVRGDAWLRNDRIV